MDGFRRAGFVCRYANDINHWAVETFRANHSDTHPDNRQIEQVDAATLRRKLDLEPLTSLLEARRARDQPTRTIPAPLLQRPGKGH